MLSALSLADFIFLFRLKLYTQVLHLMNKMNLPPPFGPISRPAATPDKQELSKTKPEAKQEETSKRKRERDDLLSSEESELDSEEDEADARKRRQVRQKKTKKRAPQVPPPASLPSQTASSTTRQGLLADHVFPISIVPKEVAPEPSKTANLKPAPQPEPEPEPEPEPAPAPAPPVPAIQKETDLNATLVELVPLEEIEARRVTGEEILAIPSFKNYQRGEPSETLYIKNLDSNTVISDLQAIFSNFLDSPGSRDTGLEIKLMKTGRLKGQSWINFHSSESATKALDHVHGYVLHGRPMIIVSAPLPLVFSLSRIVSLIPFPA